MDAGDILVASVCLVLLLIFAGFFIAILCAQSNIIHGPQFVGENGTVGATGVQGFTGTEATIPGMTGATGAQGPNSTGPTGPQGPLGPQTGPPGTLTDQIMTMNANVLSITPFTGALVSTTGGMGIGGNLFTNATRFLNGMVIAGGFGQSGSNIWNTRTGFTWFRNSTTLTGGSALQIPNGGLTATGAINVQKLILADQTVTSQTGGFTFGYSNPNFMMVSCQGALAGNPFVWDTVVASAGSAISYDSGAGFFTITKAGRYVVTWNLDWRNFPGSLNALTWGIGSFAPPPSASVQYGLRRGAVGDTDNAKYLSTNAILWITPAQLPATFYIVVQPDTTPPSGSLNPSTNNLLIEWSQAQFSP